MVVVGVKFVAIAVPVIITDAWSTVSVSVGDAVESTFDARDDINPIFSLLLLLSMCACVWVFSWQETKEPLWDRLNPIAGICLFGQINLAWMLRLIVILSCDYIQKVISIWCALLENDIESAYSGATKTNPWNSAWDFFAGWKSRRAFLPLSLSCEWCLAACAIVYAFWEYSSCTS